MFQFRSFGGRLPTHPRARKSGVTGSAVSRVAIGVARAYRPRTSGAYCLLVAEPMGGTPLPLQSLTLIPVAPRTMHGKASCLPPAHSPLIFCATPFVPISGLISLNTKQRNSPNVDLYDDFSSCRSLASAPDPTRCLAWRDYVLPGVSFLRHRSQLKRPWVRDTLKFHLGPDLFRGDTAASWLQGLTLLFFWLAC